MLWFSGLSALTTFDSATMDDYILRTIYLYKGRRTFTDVELVDLRARFTERTTARGVTGALLRIGNYFLEVNEGEHLAIDERFAEIMEDDRFEGLTMLARLRDAQPVFDNWSMSFADAGCTYYVNLLEMERLRDELEADLVDTVDNKLAVLSVIRRIAERIRSARAHGI
jgi:hypothetical protein